MGQTVLFYVIFLKNGSANEMFEKHNFNWYQEMFYFGIQHQIRIREVFLICFYDIRPFAIKMY